MRIIRIYNNNVVVTSDEQNYEMIVIGKGIGFGKKVHDSIEEDKIEKIFILKDKVIQNKLENLIRNIPEKYLKICEKIVSKIHSETDFELNESIYVTLTDHISVSLEREKNGHTINDFLDFDIQKIYKEEYKLGLIAAKVIKEETGLTISKSEIVFITLHFVNASYNYDNNKLLQITDLTNEIIKIINKCSFSEIDQESFIFQRLVRHIKFFVKRLIDKEQIYENSTVYNIISDQFPKSVNCLNEIISYIEKELILKVSNTEKSFLLYHLINIIEEKKE